MFIRFAFVVLACVSSVSAQARSLDPNTFTRVSQLVDFDQDPKLDREFHAGQVRVNTVKKTLTLVLEPRFQCPGAQICAQVMPPPIVVNLPLIRVKEDHYCKTVLYVAKEDKRSVDGNLEQVSILDRTNSICESVADASRLKTEVRHLTVTSGKQGRVDRFESSYYGLGFTPYALPSATIRSTTRR